MILGIEPRFDRVKLEELSDEELLELQQYAEGNAPPAQTYTEADYQMMLDEMKERFKRRCEVEAHFTTELAGLTVGEDVALVEMESRSGYVRIAVERTPEGDSIKLQTPDGDSEFADEEVLSTAGRWFSRSASWEDLDHTD